MEYGLELSLSFGDRNSAEIARNAILPELGAKHEHRSSTAITTNKNILRLKIRAEDRAALKASFNTYAKLIFLSRELTKEE